MRKKEIVSVLVAVGIASLVVGYMLYGPNGSSSIEEVQNGQLVNDGTSFSPSDYSMGQTFDISSYNKADSNGAGSFSGKLRITVEEAAVYDNPQQAISSGAQSASSLIGGYPNDLFSNDKDPFVYLCYTVDIENVDAVLMSTPKSSNQRLFFCDSLVSLDPPGEPVYFDPLLDGDSAGYFSLDKGQRQTITAGFAISSRDVNLDNCYLSGMEDTPSSFRVHLNVSDRRVGV